MGTECEEQSILKHQHNENVLRGNVKLRKKHFYCFILYATRKLHFPENDTRKILFFNIK